MVTPWVLAIPGEQLDPVAPAIAEGIGRPMTWGMPSASRALDMGLAYITAVRESLPQAFIAFDRFHVMQMFNKVIRDCRRAEFKAAKTLGDLTGQQTIKGSLWPLLSNRSRLAVLFRSVRAGGLLSLRNSLFIRCFCISDIMAALALKTGAGQRGSSLPI